jgi:hypothetical protein
MLIIGAASCGQEDIQSAIEIIRHAGRDYDVTIIGMDAAGMHVIPCEYVATYHPAEIQDIRTRREAIGGNLDYRLISHEGKQPGVDIVEPLNPGDRSGSSSLLGTLAALKMGYGRIILCGCPLIGKNEHGGSYDSFRIGWTNKQKYLNDRVRSMSGWTKELLGAPTDEWLLDGLDNG